MDIEIDFEIDFEIDTIIKLDIESDIEIFDIDLAFDFLLFSFHHLTFISFFLFWGGIKFFEFFEYFDRRCSPLKFNWRKKPTHTFYLTWP